MEAALKAEIMYKCDRDYVVKDGEVVIVDDFTGRLMFGRRWSDGLHQAVEAKEGVKIQQESITYATITLQNCFRLYGKLAGMTGTGLDGARRVLQDLPPRRHRHSDAPGAHPPRVLGLRLPQRGVEVPRRRKGDRGTEQAGAAPPRRHRLHREVGVPLRNVEATRRPSPGLERQVP